MKLYICYGLFKSPRPGGHPCANAHAALREAGYEPKVVKAYGLGVLPGIFNMTRGRREVKRLTGNYMVPTLVLDDGSVIDGSREIVGWARANPAARS
ncbi:MAG: glutathione S-transferase N-terminal domain-containing protein [Solirubrobacteraceae bacterium]